MKNKKIIILAIIFGILTLAFHIKFKELPTKDDIKKYNDSFSIGSNWLDQVPGNIKLKLLNGKEFILSKNIGKKTIFINFFSTHCGPCKKEIPDLNKFYLKNKDKIIFIGISVDSYKKDLTKFLSKNKIDFDISFHNECEKGPDGRTIAKYFDIRSIPTTIIIGVNGKIQLYEVGLIQNTNIAFDKIMKYESLRMKKHMNITEKQYLKKNKKIMKSSKLED